VMPARGRYPCPWARFHGWRDCRRIPSPDGRGLSHVAAGWWLTDGDAGRGRGNHGTKWICTTVISDNWMMSHPSHARSSSLMMMTPVDERNQQPQPQQHFSDSLGPNIARRLQFTLDHSTVWWSTFRHRRRRFAGRRSWMMSLTCSSWPKIDEFRSSKPVCASVSCFAYLLPNLISNLIHCVIMLLGRLCSNYCSYGWCALYISPTFVAFRA